MAATSCAPWPSRWSPTRRPASASAGTDTVYLRTYSVLILMEIVAFDNANPFPDQADLDGFLEAALGYRLRERDLRSWVPGPGWANAMATLPTLFRDAGP